MLSVTVNDEPGARVLALRGELDISSARVLEEELSASANAETLVLDLRDLRFLDSTGLRLVVGAHQRAERSGRRLVVVQGPEPVHRVFRLTQLDRHLEFVSDPAEVAGEANGNGNRGEP